MSHAHRPVHPPGARQQGFTLIEIMVVIAIIGLIMTFVGRNVMVYLADAKITATEAKMTNLEHEISRYRMKHGEVPDSLQVLLEPDPKNLGEPYLLDPANLLDAWDSEYLYTKMSKSSFEIRSLGADGQEGGEGENADISSKKASNSQN